MVLFNRCIVEVGMSRTRVLNFGSLNLDYVYHVDHIVSPGETLDAVDIQVNCGGKGLNQSIALARAGAEVFHAGMVGKDGSMLLETCRAAGVAVDLVHEVEERTGHAIIQVDRSGQNSIVLFGGANRSVTPTYIDEVLEGFGVGDVIVLQNEVNMLPQIIEAASARGLRIVLNPSPFDERISECDLARVWLFFVNEVEGMQLTGKADPDEILADLSQMFPAAGVVLTLGARGAVALVNGVRFNQPAIPCEVVDTTAAGDTFTGFFLAEYLRTSAPQRALLTAAHASSIAVSRPGAAPSVPTLDEVRAAMGER